MRYTTITACCILGLALLSAWPATAQQTDTKQDRATVITFDQLSKLQNLRSEIGEIFMHTVLPENWQVDFQGADPKTGKLVEGIDIYTMLAKPPAFKDNEASDIIFEMTVWRRGLMDGVKWTTEAERSNLEKEAFRMFLDAQLSKNIQMNFTCDTKAEDIIPKPYGFPANPEVGYSRPDFSYFVPIYFTNKQNGAKLFTFTTVVGEQPVVLKFLVNKDQAENYFGAITLIVNNTWGITKAELAEMTESAGQAQSSGGK